MTKTPFPEKDTVYEYFAFAQPPPQMEPCGLARHELGLGPVPFEKNAVVLVFFDFFALTVAFVASRLATAGLTSSVLRTGLGALSDRLGY